MAASSSSSIFNTGLALLGNTVINARQVFTSLVRGKLNTPQAIQQAAAIGVDAAPMALLICLTAGSVISLQITLRFIQTGANDYVGGLVTLALVREIGPMFTALAIACRNGTAMAAELGNMAVSEQLDALRMLHISPVRYLLAPRVVGSILALPLVTVLSTGVAILGGMLVAQVVGDLHYWKFIDSVWIMVTPYDIQMAFIKSLIFGALISLICGTLGLHTRGGAPQVGQSCRYAAIWSAVVLIITDFFLSLFMFSQVSPF